jgi:hypothetical protein
MMADSLVIAVLSLFIVPIGAAHHDEVLAILETNAPTVFIVFCLQYSPTLRKVNTLTGLCPG